MSFGFYVPSEEYVESIREMCDVFLGGATRKEEDKPMNKTNNKALKEMEGTYTLTIEGNKIKLVDKEGNVGMARCHPDDEFSLEAGMKEALAKLEEDKEAIKVGDMVEIVMPGLSYSTLGYDFFERNNIMCYAIHYRFGVTPERGTKGKVVRVTDSNSYVISVRKDKEYGDKDYTDIVCFDTIYIVGESGLRKVDSIHA